MRLPRLSWLLIDLLGAAAVIILFARCGPAARSDGGAPAHAIIIPASHHGVTCFAVIESSTGRELR